MSNRSRNNCTLSGSRVCVCIIRPSEFYCLSAYKHELAILAGFTMRIGCQAYHTTVEPATFNNRSFGYYLMASVTMTKRRPTQTPCDFLLVLGMYIDRIAQIYGCYHSRVRQNQRIGLPLPEASLALLTLATATHPPSYLVIKDERAQRLL